MSPTSIPYRLPPKLIQDSDVCKAIGCYVRASRSALGLNQLKLAQLLGVNRTTLLRLEKGNAPLRFALCQTAVEVLSALGARSTQIEELLAGRAGLGATIDLTVNFEAMKQTQEMAEQEATKNNKGFTALLGEEYIPPLAARPLRKK
jgi:DNA-binding XRE family transcriptional regulator